MRQPRSQPNFLPLEASDTQSSGRLPRPPIWVLVLAVSSSNMGISLLSPAIPLVRERFSATGDQVQLALTGFMVALGLCQLVAGTLSDRFGRRPIMIIGAFIFTLGGLGAFLATSIDMLNMMRILQGAGAAACVVMGRVVINDSFTGAEAGRQLSTITMVQAIVPVLGFAFGGIIAQAIGWRGCIGIMVISAALTLGAVFMLQGETKQNREPKIKLGRVIKAYAGLLKNPTFLASGIASGMAVSMFFVLSGVMPYQYARYGVGTFEFGVFFSLCSVGYMAGNIVNRRMAPHFGLEQLAFVGAVISGSGIGFAFFAHLFGFDTAILVTAGMVIMGFGHGLTVANSVVTSVRAAGADSGSAMGLVGASQMLIGGLLGSLVVALGGDVSFTIAMGAVLIIGMVAIIASYQAIRLVRAE